MPPIPEDDQVVVPGSYYPSPGLRTKSLSNVALRRRIASAIGSWVGGIVAHLIALIIAPRFNQVSQQPPRSPTNLPHPLEAQMNLLVQSVSGLNNRVDRLLDQLAARQESFVYEMAIRAVPPPHHHRRRQGHADATE